MTQDEQARIIGRVVLDHKAAVISLAWSASRCSVALLAAVNRALEVAELEERKRKLGL